MIASTKSQWWKYLAIMDLRKRKYIERLAPLLFLEVQ